MTNKMPARFKLKIGDAIKLKRSEFLGCPAANGVVIGLNTKEPCYIVHQRGFTHADDAFEVDHDGVTLIGPPLRGKLVRAE